MSTIVEQVSLQSGVIKRPISGVLYLRVPKTGNLIRVDVYVGSPVRRTARFTLSLAGTDILTSPNWVDLEAGDTHGSTTGITIGVTLGDLLRLDYYGPEIDISAIVTLACTFDVPTGNAVPDGGSTGQVLTKVSGADGNFDWETPSAGGSSSLHGLSDVDDTGKASGKILEYNGTQWVPVTPSSGGAGFTYYEPDFPYATPDAFDDEFNAGSLDAKWLTHNVIPSITFPVPNHAVIIPNSSSTYRGIYQAPSWSNGDTYIMKLRPTIVSGDSLNIGFLIVDNGGSLFAFNVTLNGAAATVFWEFWLNNTTLYQSDNIGTFVLGPDLYLKVKYDSSGTKKLLGWISANGVIWRQVLDTSARSFNISNAGGLTKFGIQCYGTSTTGAGVDWIRKLQGSYTGQNISV